MDHHGPSPVHGWFFLALALALGGASGWFFGAVHYPFSVAFLFPLATGVALAPLMARFWAYAAGQSRAITLCAALAAALVADVAHHVSLYRSFPVHHALEMLAATNARGPIDRPLLSAVAIEKARAALTDETGSDDLAGFLLWRVAAGIPLVRLFGVEATMTPLMSRLYTILEFLLLVWLPVAGRFAAPPAPEEPRRRRFETALLRLLAAPPRYRGG